MVSLTECGWDPAVALVEAHRYAEFLEEFGGYNAEAIREAFADAMVTFAPDQYRELVQEIQKTTAKVAKLVRLYGRPDHPQVIAANTRRHGLTMRAQYLERVYPALCN